MPDQRRSDPLRVAKLVRVSTTHLEQADSPQHQLAYADSEIAREGWIHTGLVYQAELTGAVILHRPEIQRMLRDAEAGLFDAIVLKSISRLGRDTLGLLMVKRLLDDQGIELIALADGYRSFRDPELIFLVHAHQAQAGRQEIAKNVRAGIVEVAKRGIWPAGTLPFGLRKESRTAIGLDPDTAPVVRLIYELRSQHWGATRICRYLNQEARAKAPAWWHLNQQVARLAASDPKAEDDRIQSRLRILRQRIRNGKFLWHPKTVRLILSNTAYRGEVRYNRTTGERRIHGKMVRMPRPESECITIPCPPLVSRDEWERVQAIGEVHSKLPRKRAGSRFLLSGLVACGRCGCSMRGAAAPPEAGKRGGDPKGYYACRGATEAGAHRSEYIRATDLEQAVIARLQAELASLEGPRLKVAKRPRKRVDLQQETARIEGELKDLAESRFFRRDELRKGRMTEAEFSFEMSLLQQREADLRARLAEVKRGRERQRPDDTSLAAVGETIHKLIRLEGSADAVKALLATLVRKVVVHAAGEVEVHTTFTPDELSADHA